MVQITKFSAAALLAQAAHSAPLLARQSGLTDIDVLQFALTAEHLENYFYTNALNAMPESEFLAAGFSAEYFNNLKYIAHDEQAHVELLTSAISSLGAQPVAACEYKFPYTDATGFVGLAAIIENVGSAAYLGAAPAISSKEYLTVAGSILATEAIHTGLQRAAVGLVGPASPYVSYLNPNAVYTLLSGFITSCPSSNPPLPFMAYPTLTATQGIPAAPGIPFTFTTTAQLPSSFFVTFINGLTIASMEATYENGMISAMIPEAIGGQTYAILTNANTTAIMDSQVIAGPAILEVTPDAPTYAIAQ